MFIDSSKTTKNGKTYTRHTLRNSYRDKATGKVRHINIANLTKFPEAEINAIKRALKHKNNLSVLIDSEDISLQQGKSFGALHILREIANKLGIEKAINLQIKNQKHAKLALWQIIARCIYRGSKLTAHRMSHHQALEEILGLENFSQDDVYDNLSIIMEHRDSIEKQLFKQHSKCSNLFLYDVTSSYFEGECNEYAQYGYNRDKKSGKQQLVIGLLTNDNGVPVASRVFDGNTVDTKTVAEQINLLANDFGVKKVTLVGDRGMLKSPQIELLPEGFNYITAISKVQIETLISKNVIQPELFDYELSEVVDNNIRYIMRLNPTRRDEIRATRDAKTKKLKQFIDEQNLYLKEHTKAKLNLAVKKVNNKLERYNLNYITIGKDDDSRVISIVIDKNLFENTEKFDGCYCLKTDILDCNKSIIHQRYKDLSKVESAFRTMKTECLELRPIYVRKKESTDAHVFIVTLSYMIIQELEKLLHGQTPHKVLEVIGLFNTLTYVEVNTGQNSFVRLPTPTPEIQKLIELTKVTLTVLNKKIKVAQNQ